MQKFDPKRYIAQLSIDCVVFGYAGKELKVLISKPKYTKKAWALPGGYILKTEDIDEAAHRILKERTALENLFLEQFRVFGGANRIVDSPYREMIKEGLSQYDPQGFDAETIEWLSSRFVCIGYYALVDIHKVTPHNGEFDERLEWRDIKDIPPLTHDHNEILESAIQALRQNLDQKLIGFNLLPETFTMRDVQELYEVVYGRPFAINNFQKKILDLNVLERLEKKVTGSASRAPYLYRFKK